MCEETLEMLKRFGKIFDNARISEEKANKLMRSVQINNSRMDIFFFMKNKIESCNNKNIIRSSDVYDSNLANRNKNTSYPVKIKDKLKSVHFIDEENISYELFFVLMNSFIHGNEYFNSIGLCNMIHYKNNPEMSVFFETIKLLSKLSTKSSYDNFKHMIPGSLSKKNCFDVLSEFKISTKNDLFVNLTLVIYMIIKDLNNINIGLLYLNSIDFNNYDRICPDKKYTFANLLHCFHEHNTYLRFKPINFHKTKNILENYEKYFTTLKKYKKAKNKFNFLLRHYKKVHSLPNAFRGVIFEDTEKNDNHELDYNILGLFLIDLSMFNQQLHFIIRCIILQDTNNHFYKKYYILVYYFKLLKHVRVFKKSDMSECSVFLKGFLTKYCTNEKFKAEKLKKHNKIIGEEKNYHPNKNTSAGYILKKLKKYMM